MALPINGGGYQIGDGNANEIDMIALTAPQTATSSATLTVGQLLGGLLVANPSTSAASYALPTGAAMDAAMANAHTDIAIFVPVVNLGTSSGALTFTASTGITIVGSAVVAVTSSAQFYLRKTDVATWVLYRIA